MDGAEGVDGKTVRLNAEDYSILYDSSGSNPSHSGTVTVNGQANTGINITATARNFTDALFRFKEPEEVLVVMLMEQLHQVQTHKQPL